MGRSLGRFKVSGVLITICVGLFQICIQKILDLGQEAFIIRGTFINRKKGLNVYIYLDLQSTPIIACLPKQGVSRPLCWALERPR